MVNNRSLPDVEERRRIVSEMPWVAELPLDEARTACQAMALNTGKAHPCKISARWEYTTSTNKTRKFCFIHLVWRGLYSTDVEIKRTNKFLKTKYPQYAEGIIR